MADHSSDPPGSRHQLMPCGQPELSQQHLGMNVLFGRRGVRHGGTPVGHASRRPMARTIGSVGQLRQHAGMLRSCPETTSARLTAVPGTSSRHADATSGRDISRWGCVEGSRRPCAVAQRRVAGLARASACGPRRGISWRCGCHPACDDGARRHHRPGLAKGDLLSRLPAFDAFGVRFVNQSMLTEEGRSPKLSGRGPQLWRLHALPY
jgi:hypothetical protein